MQRHKSIHPHSLTKTVSGDNVLHYLIRFDPATENFFHRETGEEIRVSSHDVNKDYAGWFILTRTVLLVDGTTADSSQLYCNINTGACFNRTTEQPVQLQPNQVHLVVIDSQNGNNDEYVLKLIQTRLKTHHGKSVRIKQVRKDFFGPFYNVEYENERIQSINFDDLRLTKVVDVYDGDIYYFYSKCDPEYNAFGSTRLFEIV